MEASARVTGIFSSILISYQRCRPNRRRLSANRPPSAYTRRISVAPSLGRYLVEPRVARLDFAARKGAYLQRLRLFVQLNPHPTPYGNVVAVMGIIPVFPGGLADAIPGNRFFHARSAKVRP